MRAAVLNYCNLYLRNLEDKKEGKTGAARDWRPHGERVRRSAETGSVEALLTVESAMQPVEPRFRA